MLRVVAFSAGTRRPSKTSALVEAVANACSQDASGQTRLYDLLDVGLEFGAATRRDGLPASARGILEEIETADGLIVGSPVYKGAYSGQFKHFFDFIEPSALERTPVCLVATGGGLRHALVVEQFLRPLFGFFGAHTVPTAVYASDQDFAGYEITEDSVLRRIERAGEEFKMLLRATKQSNIKLAS
jgi:FMN reductase